MSNEQKNTGMTIPSIPTPRQERANMKTADLNWLEIHRPKALDEMALTDPNRRLLQAYLDADMPPHLLLHGPAGCGKTTLARILSRETGAFKVPINASDDRGLAMVREKVKQSIRSRPLSGEPFRLFVLEEADGLTPEAQDALLSVMEENAANSRFLLLANEPDRISKPLWSRCTTIDMGDIPPQERARVLGNLLASEGYEVSHGTVFGLALRFTDMRQLITEAQKAVLTYGELQYPAPLEPPVPWPEPVQIDDLLTAIESTLQRHISLPEGASTAIALWILFAHAHDAFFVSPILTVTSPVKRAGKTSLFTVLHALTPSPLLASNISGAAIYRSVTAFQPTLLIDEVDTLDDLRSELRGILNSGHTRNAAQVIRCHLGGSVVQCFSTFCPKALALIRSKPTDLPSTLEDRSIAVGMRRARPGEGIEPIRLDRIFQDLAELRRKAARFALDNQSALQSADPRVPEGLDARQADNWRPLLGIAELAGSEWSKRAAEAALILTGNQGESEEAIQLLVDLETLFEETGAERLSTQFILQALSVREERPWSRLDAMRLANLLRPFGVTSKPTWSSYQSTKKRTLRGYFREDLEDVFARYVTGRGR